MVLPRRHFGGVRLSWRGISSVESRLVLVDDDVEDNDIRDSIGSILFQESS